MQRAAEAPRLNEAAALVQLTAHICGRDAIDAQAEADLRSRQHLCLDEADVAHDVHEARA